MVADGFDVVEGFRGGGDRVTVWVMGVGQVTVWVWVCWRGDGLWRGRAWQAGFQRGFR